MIHLQPELKIRIGALFYGVLVIQDSSELIFQIFLVIIFINECTRLKIPFLSIIHQTNLK